MEELELYLADKQVENSKLINIIEKQESKITALTVENNKMTI